MKVSYRRLLGPFSIGWCLNTYPFTINVSQKDSPWTGDLLQRNLISAAKGARPVLSAGPKLEILVLQWEAQLVAFSPSLGRVFSVPASLLPGKGLGLSSAEPLDAAGFKLPGTAELFLIVLPIGRHESFWISYAGGFPSGGSLNTEKENWLNNFTLVYRHPLKWYSTYPRCELQMFICLEKALTEI